MLQALLAILTVTSRLGVLGRYVDQSTVDDILPFYVSKRCLTMFGMEMESTLEASTVL